MGAAAEVRQPSGHLPGACVPGKAGEETSLRLFGDDAAGLCNRPGGRRTECRNLGHRHGVIADLEVVDVAVALRRAVIGEEVHAGIGPGRKVDRPGARVVDSVCGIADRVVRDAIYVNLHLVGGESEIHRDDDAVPGVNRRTRAPVVAVIPHVPGTRLEPEVAVPVAVGVAVEDRAPAAVIRVQDVEDQGVLVEAGSATILGGVGEEPDRVSGAAGCEGVVVDLLVGPVHQRYAEGAAGAELARGCSGGAVERPVEADVGLEVAVELPGARYVTGLRRAVRVQQEPEVEKQSAHKMFSCSYAAFHCSSLSICRTRTVRPNPIIVSDTSGNKQAAPTLSLPPPMDSHRLLAGFN